MTPRKPGAASWLAWVLVLAGLVRVGLIVMDQPLLGYANQFDMVRTSACIGLYPDLPPPAHLQATTAAPIAVYRTGERVAAGCYLSSEVLVAAAAMRLSMWARDVEDRVPLRHVGLLKAGLLALAALSIAALLHPYPGAALVHGVIVLFVLADPVATLWMNTLYTEFTTFWGLYVVTSATCILALTPRWRSLTAALLFAGLLTLAFSREQFALLPPALMLMAMPWLWPRSRGLAIAAVGTATVASVVSFAFLPRQPEIAQTNRVNAYLGVIVPAAQEPARALATLGLPERCSVLVGATSYLRRGESLERECPEAQRLASIAFLKFLQDEPAVLARSVARLLPTLQAPSPTYVGVMQGREFATLRDLPAWHVSPVDWALARLPLALHAALVIAALIAVPLATLAALAFARPAREKPAVPVLMALLLSATTAYALATTVFGDGLAESARHFLPGTLALVAGVVAAAVALPSLARRWNDRPSAHAIEIGVAAFALVTTATAVVLALRWAQAQPLAIGVIDEPSGREIPADGTTVRGWALDPSGVAAVEAVVGEARLVTEFGQRVKPGLAPLYPAYPDAARAAFELRLDARQVALLFPQGEGDLRIVVRSRAGPTTEIDRRRIVVR